MMMARKANGAHVDGGESGAHDGFAIGKIDGRRHEVDLSVGCRLMMGWDRMDGIGWVG